jgi:hypothetical protein
MTGAVSEAYERVMAASERGIYESHYLKANSPDGQRAFWLKHNALRPIEGDGVAEFWAVLFERGERPVVVKRERRWSLVEASREEVHISCPEPGAVGVELASDKARGQVGHVSWDLALHSAQPPLVHFPLSRMYTGSFPKKKMLTPAPNLCFDGWIQAGSERWEVGSWIGLRGHNWGREHAYRYAYGSCNVWEDGHRTRAIDGFSAQIKLGRRTSPWLTAVVGRDPLVAKNELRHWLGAGLVEPGRWQARWRRPGLFFGGSVEVEFRADPASYAGLRYLHPDGRESYCYNTKFADVRLLTQGRTYRSRCGELEVLFPEPLPDIPLHPTPGWDPEKGDYQSS